jgi:signal transduction histidine kinase
MKSPVKQTEYFSMVQKSFLNHANIEDINPKKQRGKGSPGSPLQLSRSWVIIGRMTDVSAKTLADLIRRQESLREVIESISSELELRPLLTRIVQQACELLNADRGTIGLVDDERQLIRTEAAYRMPPDELGAEMSAGVGLAGRVYESKQVIILNQYGDLEQTTQPDLIQDAVIGLPIFWRHQLIGFFGIGAAPPRVFNQQDVELLSLLARHAAIAIHNAQQYARTQQALNEMQLLYRTSQEIGAARNVKEVIEAYLNQVATRGRYACTIVLYEFDADDRRAAVLVRGRWAPAEGMRLMDESLPYTQDTLDPLLDTGKTAAIVNVFEDPRVSESLRAIQRQSKRPALAFIPLMVRGRRIGLVVLSYPEVHQWPKNNLQLYQATAAQLATAIDSRQQQGLLFEQGQQIAVLEERQRLARELHDSVTQLLFSITLIAQSLTPAWKRNAEEGEKRVHRLLELSQSALAEMRALLTKLRPAEPARPGAPVPGLLRLRQDGLVAALCHYAGEIAGDNLKVEVLSDGYPAPTEPAGAPAFAHEEVLYRIAQEALNNVVKHARAQRVEIRIQGEDGLVQLTVTDNGRGFVPPANGELESGGMGLKTMRERAEGVRGTMSLNSQPAQGTTIEIKIPVERRND